MPARHHQRRRHRRPSAVLRNARPSHLMQANLLLRNLALKLAKAVSSSLVRLLNDCLRVPGLQMWRYGRQDSLFERIGIGLIDKL